MKTIYETFKKSVYDPVFYKSASEQPLESIFKYYFKMALILGAAMTVVLGAVLVPQGVSFMRDHAGEMVKTYYPAELVVNIGKGEATANVPMPYIVPVKQITGVAPVAGAMQNMIVIDTTQGFDEKTFEDYKTYALLTKTKIVTQSDKGQITIQSLRGVPITTVSQEVLLSWVEKIHKSLGLIVSIGLVATFIIFTFEYIVYLAPLLIFALVPFLIAWLKKTPLSYSGAYKISLYAIIPALALKTLLNLMGILFLPSYFTLLVFMLIVAINMRDEAVPTLFENK